MLVTLLVVAPFGLVLAVLSLPALAGTAAGLAATAALLAAFRRACRRTVFVPPGDPPPRPKGTVPVLTDLPEREERQAFAYDNGLVIGVAGEDS